MSMIEVNNISKSFRVAKRDGNFLKFMFNRKYTAIEALKNITFKIESGETVGLIGPNGAGKSTMVKILTGILIPTNGEVIINGIVPYEHRTENAKHIGVLFGQRSQLWWDLPVKDTYVLLKKIYKISDDTFQKNIDKYNKVLGIEEFYTQPVRQLSLGQRMRAELGATLLHDPKIIYLDEPTIGLDVVAKKQIRNLIKELNKYTNTTIILTSHDMKDVEETCDRIICIDKGKIVSDMSMQEIKKTFGGNSTIVVDFNNVPNDFKIDNVEIKNSNGTRYILTYDTEKNTAGKIISQLVRKFDIDNISIEEPSIDDVVSNLYNLKS